MYVDCEPAIIHCWRASWRVFEHANARVCVSLAAAVIGSDRVVSVSPRRRDAVSARQLTLTSHSRQPHAQRQTCPPSVVHFLPFSSPLMHINASFNFLFFCVPPHLFSHPCCDSASQHPFQPSLPSLNLQRERDMGLTTSQGLFSVQAGWRAPLRAISPNTINMRKLQKSMFKHNLITLRAILFSKFTHLTYFLIIFFFLPPRFSFLILGSANVFQ